MSRKLQWPDDRGTFVDNDADRANVVGDDDGRGRFEAAPGTVIEVDDADVADHYLDRGWVEADDDADVTEDGEPTELAYDDFAAMGYEDRVAAVEAGRVDDHLDRIADEDGSSNVQDAVEQRQEEIGV